MSTKLAYHCPADRFDIAIDGTFLLDIPTDDHPPSISFNGVEWLQLPQDEQDYAYTHGGREYRAACKAAWAEIARRAPTGAAT